MQDFQKIEKLLEEVCRYRLKTFARFSDYSSLQMAEIYNGIGAEWMPDQVRALITRFTAIFEASALEHDVFTHHLILAYATFKFSRQWMMARNHEGNLRFHANNDVLIEEKYSWYNPLRYYYYYLNNKLYNALEHFGLIGIKIGAHNPQFVSKNGIPLTLYSGNFSSPDVLAECDLIPDEVNV